MKEEDLNKVIQILEQNSSEEDAYFEFYFEDLPDFETIQANKDGLIVYAISLLKATKQFELRNLQREEGDIDNLIKFEIGAWYANESDSLPYIKPIFQKRNEIVKPQIYKATWKETIYESGCVLGLIILIIVIVVGFLVIFNSIIEAIF